MEEGVFPHQRALKPDAAPEEMAEERRLCYVGFTRARKRLFVSLAQSRSLFGELKFNAPSRFLSDVPQGLVDFKGAPMPEAPRPYSGLPPMAQRRRERYDEDDGPRIDRSYAQTSDFDGGDDVRGTRVTHEQFGRGVIVECDGRGPNAKLTVRFDSVGLKRVIARFLTPE
jgi:DNA helicase-2/ATP-dependent DNA helicase PcrA